jgi:hypothetical protein
MDIFRDFRVLFVTSVFGKSKPEKNLVVLQGWWLAATEKSPPLF